MAGLTPFADKFTPLRQAELVYSVEALRSRQAFQESSQYEQDSIIEFLKTLQVLPPGTKHPVVDENGNANRWPPHDHDHHRVGRK